ncbi:MAG: exosome complex RNA-binding protein Rrp4 [Methanomassiliicoccales archaeon]
MEQSSEVGQRLIVVPGEKIELNGRKAGNGIYRHAGVYYSSRLGIVASRGGWLEVIPLSGKYLPIPGDEIVATVVDMGPSNWLLDMNSPYPGVLHVSETPWKIEYGATAKYLDIGDNVTARVVSVDESNHVQVTMRDRDLRKLRGGSTVDVPASKVPRVIGKGGSMIDMLKRLSGCKIIVGKNGRIWMEGEVDRMILLSEAIRIIDEQAQRHGLTDSVRNLLENAGTRRGNQ